MSNASVIFSFEGENILIQCSKEDKMKDICQKYSNKIKKNINTLVFLYGGNQLNFNLKLKDVITDKEINEIKVLVYSNESDEFICPKCGEKIKFNTEKINDIKSFINNINDSIKGAKIILKIY